jgi:hypothetical protein
VFGSRLRTGQADVAGFDQLDDGGRSVANDLLRENDHFPIDLGAPRSVFESFNIRSGNRGLFLYCLRRATDL